MHFEKLHLFSSYSLRKMKIRNLFLARTNSSFHLVKSTEVTQVKLLKHFIVKHSKKHFQQIFSDNKILAVQRVAKN